VRCMRDAEAAATSRPRNSQGQAARVAKFDRRHRCPAKARPRHPIPGTSRQGLIAEAEHDKSIVANPTPPLPSGHRRQSLRRPLLRASFDVGIAEQHAVTSPAGMATEGWKQFCDILFDLPAARYDKVVHTSPSNRCAVRLRIDAPGWSRCRRRTMRAVRRTYCRPLPGFCVMAAAESGVRA